MSFVEIVISIFMLSVMSAVLSISLSSNNDMKSSISERDYVYEVNSDITEKIIKYIENQDIDITTTNEEDINDMIDNKLGEYIYEGYNTSIKIIKEGLQDTSTYYLQNTIKSSKTKSIYVFYKTVPEVLIYEQ
ncbi:MAG TPA: hypothetical protein DEP72_02115 [Clostridiales bacterium]|nr:MAG: hypothetical protein A2Y18_00305 [Clostridiales bacterium GWD2_32_19]HCC06951.1 hypothetical protein [Clostridiales bacterium]